MMNLIVYFAAMIQRVILSCVFFFIVFSSSSQEYFVQNYSMKNGLPNNQLHNIIQAKDNTLWFTSFYGVTQFDGANFTTFTEEDGLISNHILTVFEDSKERIWVSPWNQEGINLIENGEVISFNDSVLQTKWMMITVYEDKKGRIWFFGNNTVIKYENEAFELVFSSPNIKEYLHPNGLAVINDNELYLTQMENGVIKVTLEPFSIEHINQESHGINNICYSALKDKNGTYWFGCYGAIYSFENGVMTEHHIPLDFDKCRVWGIDEDEDGYLWLATYGGGIIRWDKKEEFIVINSKNGLTDDFCYAVLVDNENNKWITTDVGGLNKLTDFSFEYFTQKSGLKSNQVYGITQQKNGAIVLGTDKGFSIIKDNEVDTTLYQNMSISSFSTGENDIWYTSKSGYGIFNEDYSISNFDHSNTYNFIDAKESVVAGLSRVLHKGKEVFFHEFLIITSSFYFNDVLYIGTNYGIIQDKNGEITQLENLNHAAFSEISISLKISKNEVLIANPNELVYLKNSADSLEIKHFSSKKLGGLIRIFSMLLDGNDLWVGAQNTLAKINFNELVNNNHLIIEKYDVSSGFLQGLNAPGAIFKDNSGAIWVGTSEGAVKFNPKLAHKNNVPPTLKIKEIRLFNQKIDPKLYRNEAKNTFTYEENHLTFHFQAVSLSKPSAVKIKYRLVGLDKNWSSPSKNHPISFPFLNPGEYTFEFMASNGDGVWSKTPLRYSFVISPPFWQTYWFFALVFTILIGGVYFLFHRQKMGAILKQKNQEKFTQNIIKAQEEERKRISKGLHDGIGQNLLLIKNALQTNKIDGAKNMVSTTIEEVRTISRNLHPFQLEKFGLTKALESMVEELDQSFDEIIFTEEIDAIDDLFSKEEEINIYRIVQESVNNIIKHANATAARIVIVKKEKYLELFIFDNGKGFDLEKNKDIINSLGLKSIRERVKYLKGTVNFESKINAGTKISIKIAYEPR